MHLSVLVKVFQEEYQYQHGSKRALKVILKRLEFIELQVIIFKMILKSGKPKENGKMRFSHIDLTLTEFLCL